MSSPIPLTATRRAQGQQPPTPGAAVALVESKLRDRGSRTNGRGAWQCPAHDDRTPSLQVSQGAKGAILKCFAGCTTHEITAALGLTFKDLFDEPLPARRSRTVAKGRKPRREVASYRYESGDGELLFEVVRFEPKGFAQRTPDGSGGFRWGRKGVPEVPYQLPEILAAVAAEDTVYVVEGEKDAEALCDVGCVATCNAGGAGKWREEFAAYFEGADVVVVADRDEPGRQHAAAVRDSLAPVARSVRVVEAREGKDAADHVAAGHTIDELVAVDLDKATAAEAPDDGDASDGGISDHGNALLFEAYCSDDFRYPPPIGWVNYNPSQGIWRPDEAAALRRWLELGQSLQRSAADCGDPEATRTKFEHGRRFRNATTARHGLECAAVLESIRVDADALDADPYLFNAANCVIDLRSGNTLPHSRAYLMTRRSPVAWDENAQAPRFTEFLEQVLPDAAARTFLQRWIAYCLTGDTSEEIFVLMHGGGANGKSTVDHIARALLGTYWCHLPDGAILRTGSAETPERALVSLPGARLATTTELSDGQLREATVKTIVSGEPMIARQLYREAHEFRPTAKLMLSTNTLPRVRGVDDGIWRRVRVLNFPVTIPADQRDRRLKQRLEVELPGILRWALEGCLDWQRDGLAEPESMRLDTGSYRQAENPVSGFVEECCRRDAESFVRTAELHALYLDWAKRSGVKNPLNARSFGRFLGALDGLAPAKGTAGVRGWRGLALTVRAK